MTIKYCNLIPVFDTLNEMIELHRFVYKVEKAKVNLPSFAINDYRIALNFLYSYRGSSQTFNAYRREIERLIQWCWFVREKSILKLKRENIEAFIEFCIKPYKRWIGTKIVARFILKAGSKEPNPKWRPFEISLNKQDIKAGKIPNKDDYQFSQKAIKALFAILSSFYNYCLQEEVATVNPVALIRQKSKFLRQETTAPVRV